jgi:hypothetical protein
VNGRRTNEAVNMASHPAPLREALKHGVEDCYAPELCHTHLSNFRLVNSKPNGR